MDITLFAFGWILFVGVAFALMAEAGRRNRPGDPPPPRPPAEKDG